MTRFSPGDRVLYSGAWGRNTPVPAVVVSVGEECGQDAYTVETESGARPWGWEWQLTRDAEYPLEREAEPPIPLVGRAA